MRAVVSTRGAGIGPGGPAARSQRDGRDAASRPRAPRHATANGTIARRGRVGQQDARDKAGRPISELAHPATRSSVPSRAGSRVVVAWARAGILAHVPPRSRSRSTASCSATTRPRSAASRSRPSAPASPASGRPELHRSATVPLAVAAAATERIELGTGIALAFTRSPMVLALEALDLDELSGGRFVLGLGAGVRRLNASWHAAAYDPPVRRMRELVAAARELMAALTEGRDARAPGGSTTSRSAACAAGAPPRGPRRRSGSRRCSRA